MKGIIQNLLIVFLITGCQSTNNSKLDEFENKLLEIHSRNVETDSLETGWYHIMNEASAFKRYFHKTQSVFYIDPKPVVIIDNFKECKETTNISGFEGMAVYFDKAGKMNWKRATKAAIGSNLVFIFDNEIIMAPKVHSEITTGVCVFWYDELSVEVLQKIKSICNE